MDSSKRRTRLAGVMVAAGLAALATGAVFVPGTDAVAGAGSLAGAGHRPAVHRRAPSVAGATLALAPRRPGSLMTPRPQSHTDPGRGPLRLAGAAPASEEARDHSAPTVASPVASAGGTTAALVAGVGPIPPGWVATAHTVVTAGLTRLYLTVEPAHLTLGLPVVLLMHGRGMTPDTVLRISRLADEIGPAVLVVPGGWDRSWNAGDCCGAAYRAGVDDVAFLRAVMSEVLSADPGGRMAKAYAVGFSNGGRLTYLLACQMPGVFTGFVAVEAVPVEACTPPRPLDMTIVAQQSDPLLTVGSGQPKVIGGFTEPTVIATVNRMASADHCRTGPAVADFGLAVERTWTCAGGASLRYVWYPSGGHSWRPTVGGTPGVTDFVLQILGKWNPADHSGGPEVGVTRPGGASGT